jgi:hypothetical protein
MSIKIEKVTAGYTCGSVEETRNRNNILVRKPSGKLPLGRLQRIIVRIFGK